MAAAAVPAPMTVTSAGSQRRSAGRDDASRSAPSATQPPTAPPNAHMPVDSSGRGPLLFSVAGTMVATAKHVNPTAVTVMVVVDAFVMVATRMTRILPSSASSGKCSCSVSRMYSAHPTTAAAHASSVRPAAAHSAEHVPRRGAGSHPVGDPLSGVAAVKSAAGDASVPAPAPPGDAATLTTTPAGAGDDAELGTVAAPYRPLLAGNTRVRLQQVHATTRRHHRATARMADVTAAAPAPAPRRAATVGSPSDVSSLLSCSSPRHTDGMRCRLLFRVLMPIPRDGVTTGGRWPKTAAGVLPPPPPTGLAPSATTCRSVPAPPAAGECAGVPTARPGSLRTGEGVNVCDDGGMVLVPPPALALGPWPVPAPPPAPT